MARTYNALQGRFRQVDPLPGQDGLTDTAYSYASQDPVNRVDPTGLISVDDLSGYVNQGRYCFSIWMLRKTICATAAAWRQPALDRTTQVFEGERNNDGDPANAFQHGYYSASITRGVMDAYKDYENPTPHSIGNEVYTFLDAHEKDNLNGCAKLNTSNDRWAKHNCRRQTQMDRVNNGVGISFAVNSHRDCTDRRSGWVTRCALRGMRSGALRRIKYRGGKAIVVRTTAADLPTNWCKTSGACPQ
jgi:hypothetical protein